jgi:hypothetical protein
MAQFKIVLEDKEVDIQSLKLNGCQLKDGDVAIRFTEHDKEEPQIYMDVILGEDEADFIVGSIAGFYNCTIVKKEGV